MISAPTQVGNLGTNLCRGHQVRPQPLPFGRFCFSGYSETSCRDLQRSAGEVPARTVERPYEVRGQALSVPRLEDGINSGGLACTKPIATIEDAAIRVKD